MKESWLANFWRGSRKGYVSEPEKAVVGILSFEVASLMSKVVNLWQCLNDKQMGRLRQEIINSFGIQKLVSDNEDYLMDLALAEIFENLSSVAKSLARLGKRCVDPMYQCLEHVFDDPIEIDLSWWGWDYRLKKMERKVKKMERFAAATSQLYQELEVLIELEQSLRRMQANVNINQVKLHEFHQKVMWQRQEVNNLREMSPWVRTFDYTVRLLLRSLFTVVKRIKHVFAIDHKEYAEGGNDPRYLNNGCLVRSNSISAPTQSSVHPSENHLSSGPLGRSVSNLGLSNHKNRLQNKKLRTPYHSSVLFRKHPSGRSKRLAHVGPFKGCMTAGYNSPTAESCMPGSSSSLRFADILQIDIGHIDKTNMLQPEPLSRRKMNIPKVSIFNSKCKILNASVSTLGDAALALHYANLIILIEKLAFSPHLIGLDARDDLYNMLPTSIKNSLRAKLRLFSKTEASSVYDSGLASDWSLTLGRILEWLAPLAHNMIRWHSERNFEKQRMVSRTNVLLVQTLYFANQAKSEAAITELLMGLQYISRFGREINVQAFMGSACGRACDNYLLHKDNIAVGMVDHT